MASVHSGCSDDDRELAVPAAGDLVLEHGRKRVRAAADPDHAGGNALRLDPDGDRVARRRPRASARSLPGKPAERTELVAGDQHLLRRDSRAATASCITHSPESDLSVSPISTCLASLVTLGSAKPASVAARACDLDRLGQPVDPRRGQTGLAPPRAARSIRAFGGSAHSGSGIRSILRRFNRSETIRAASPRAASRSTVSCRRTRQRRVLVALAVRRYTSVAPRDRRGTPPTRG